MRATSEIGRGASANRRAAGRLSSWLCVAALCCGAWSSAPAQELMLAKALPDLVAESEFVTVADLVGAQARRNSRGNLIVTDYRFRVAQALQGAAPAAEFVLTQGGGTLAGETHELSDTAKLDVGSRYLLFVRPGRGEVFSPFVGGAQGVYLLSSDGKAMSLGGDRRKLAEDALLDQVRELAGARGTQPPRNPDAGRTPGNYPAKRYLPIAMTPPDAVASISPAPELAGTHPQAPDAASGAHVTAMPGEQRYSGPGIDYQYLNRITPPAVINGFPHDWSWHPEEEYQMSKWNQYGGLVFQVYATPTGDWAWGNDRFDLAGWPSNDDMLAQFGEGWGATTLGITYSRWFDDGPIIEADTALNPAYCWTLDERQGLNETDSCWGFRQTMLHELGHSWGLKHPWEFQDVWWDSVMNYSPKHDRFPVLFSDDTNAVRAAFGGPGIHDALLSLYTTALDSSDGAQSAIYTPTQLYSLSVHHGEDLSAWITNQFKIENLGTDDIVTPSVDFYLSQGRLTWDAGYAYLGSGSYISVPVFSTYTYWMPSLPIPATTPTGNYYLAAYLPADDNNLANNGAWADEDTTVHVDNNPQHLAPDLNWQASEYGYLGPAGDWTFEFDGEEGTTYYFSMCPDTGGWADFDTTLAIEYFGSQLAFDDDTCDYQSNIVWTAPYSATFTVRVSSYNDEYQGTFQLGFRRDITQIIFRGGFDG